MITLSLRTGRMRAEGYAVYFEGWRDYQFVCHHADKNGETEETRWVVSEKISGKRLTVNDYATDEEAIVAAERWLNMTRPYRRPLLDKAISEAARRAE